MPSAPKTYSELVSGLLDIINLLVEALFAFLFIYFLWKMIDSWILHAGDQTKREEGRKYAVSAVIVFVVMVGIWGIVVLLKQSIFG